MNDSTYNERTSVSAWPCQDVDLLYEKISKVGCGTYGEVNKARLRSDPTKLVALKKIKDQSETQGFPITALREINLLQQCSHPNVINLLNVATSNLPDPDSKKKNNKKRGSTYLVFEYMEHELLGLVQTNQFTDAQVKCIMKQILEGLDYIHSKNIIHRDIKSANILMNNRGEVKLADFGLARKISPGFSGKLTQRVVTRWYRAPELLLGCRKYGPQIDLWALGCVFAELLMGKSHALFPAQKTPDEFALICEKCGTPNESSWPGHKDLPYYNTMAPKKSFPRVLMAYMCRQNKNLDALALDLLDKMLTFNPDTRITTKKALEHPYFRTNPLPCPVNEMPKFEKDCHAYVLNLKRKVRVNVKNSITNTNNFALDKVPLPSQTLNQPSINFYDPTNILPSYQAKNVYGNQNNINPANPQIYQDTNQNNMNNNYNGLLPNNTANMGNMKHVNNLVNTSQGSMNNMSNMNNMHMGGLNNLGNVSKLNSMHSTNTFTSNSTLDTTITNMTNLSSLNDFSNMSNVSNLSNMSNMSSMNNMSNMNNLNNLSTMTSLNNLSNSSNSSYYNKLPQSQPQQQQQQQQQYMPQVNSNSGYNMNNNMMNNTNLNLMHDKMFSNYLNYQYYFSIMNFSVLQYNKMEQDLALNAAMASFLNNNNNTNQVPEMNHNNYYANPIVQQDDPIFEQNIVVPDQKPKTQKKRSRKTNQKNTNLDERVYDDKKILETLDELGLEFLKYYKDADTSSNCKRPGSPAIHDLDLVQKRQMPNPLDVE